MASMDTVRSDPRYLAELERQLEVKEESLKKLNELLAQKEDLLLATSEKLCQSEKRKVELVTFSIPLLRGFRKIKTKIRKAIQAALVIRGLFICEFAYSHLKNNLK
jgi:hypothetical protein